MRWRNPTRSNAVRRPLALLTTAVLALGLIAPSAATAAQQDQGQPGEVELRTTTTPAMLPGEISWVNIMWRATGADVSDVVVTVNGSKLQTSYPSGRDHTSFTDSRDLAAEMTDFTALRVEMPAGAKKSEKLRLRLEYVSAGETVVKDKLDVEIPVRDAGGLPYVRQTDSVAVQSGGPTWVHVFFEGLQPNTGFTVTTDALGGSVRYPEGRTDSSLRGDDRLDPAEKDYVALLIDATDLAPGTHELPLSVATSAGSGIETVTLQVS